jgi:hypothetical protein
MLPNVLNAVTYKTFVSFDLLKDFMNWIRLLDDQLNFTKKNKYQGMVIDNNISQSLKNITDSVIPFGPSEFISAISLQGQEKMISFENQFPFQEWNVLLFGDNLSRFSIRCYTLMNPSLAESREIHSTHNMGWMFFINTPNFTFKSKVLTFLENDFVSINFRDNKINIKLIDNKTSIQFKITEKDVSVIWKSSDLQEELLNIHRLPTKNPKNGITFHFENVYDEKEYSQLEPTENYNKGIFEHNKRIYRTEYIHRMIYNIIYIFNPELNYKSIRFIIFFDNAKNIILDIKQPEIENVVFFIGALLSELKRADTLPIPEKWKLTTGINNFYIVKKETYDIIDPIGSDIIMETSILNNKNEIIGYGCMIYHNWDNIAVIKRKLKILYPPLERPEYEIFMNKPFGSSSPIVRVLIISILSILVLLICIFIAVG